MRTERRVRTTETQRSRAPPIRAPAYPTQTTVARTREEEPVSAPLAGLTREPYPQACQ